jgi:hypothetical protein
MIEETIGYFIGISESVCLRKEQTNTVAIFRVTTQVEGQGGPSHIQYIGKDPVKANEMFSVQFMRIYSEMMLSGHTFK